MGRSGISWTICKSFAPHSRQITMPVPHHSIFYGPGALPDAQPTVSKHWRPIQGYIFTAQFDTPYDIWNTFTSDSHTSFVHSSSNAFKISLVLVFLYNSKYSSRETKGKWHQLCHSLVRPSVTQPTLHPVRGINNTKINAIEKRCNNAERQHMKQRRNAACKVNKPYHVPHGTGHFCKLMTHVGCYRWHIHTPVQRV